MKQLLLFGEEHDAAYIFLTFKNENHDYIEAYRNFLISEEEIMTAKGKMIEVAISTKIETYDSIIDFKDNFHEEFLKTLWHDQRKNFTIREHLKRYLSRHV